MLFAACLRYPAPISRKGTDDALSVDYYHVTTFFLYVERVSY